MLFSIIVPTYNRAHLILETLISIKEQVYSNYEVIIVDDGSNDNTDVVVIEFINRNHLQNWIYSKTLNRERGAARNHGYKLSQGKFITFLDSDDLFYPHHLNLAHEFLIKHPECRLFHCAYEFKNKKLHKTTRVEYPNSKVLNKAVLKGNILSCFGVFIEKEVFKNNNFNEDRDLSGSEDWLLWLKLSARYPFLFQSTVSGCMIQHTERSVLGFSKDKLLKRAELLKLSLEQDEIFLSKFGINSIQNIYSHMLSYCALHLILSNEKVAGLRLFINSLRINFKELFHKRTLGILKNLFLG